MQEKVLIYDDTFRQEFADAIRYVAFDLHNPDAAQRLSNTTKEAQNKAHGMLQNRNAPCADLFGVYVSNSIYLMRIHLVLPFYGSSAHAPLFATAYVHFTEWDNGGASGFGVHLPHACAHFTARPGRYMWFATSNASQMPYMIFDTFFASPST